MSDFYSNMRALSARLFERFGRKAVISNTTKTYDKRLDKTVSSTAEQDCLATLSTRQITNENGVIMNQRIATVNQAIKAGDTLVMANEKYLVGDVEIVAPDGLEPINYKAVIK